MKIFNLVILYQLSQVSWCQPQQSNRRPGSSRNRQQAPRFQPVSGARNRGTQKSNRFTGGSSSRGQSFLPPLPDYEDDYYYYYDDPLPSGPTRRPPDTIRPDEEYYYYQEEDPLPAGPTREPPLPSGPTRRPGQPTTHTPGFRGPTTISPALNQWLNLPLLTTARPFTGRRTKKKNNNLDIVHQTKLFASKDPNQEQFIAPPKVNAGALPLSFNPDLAANQFPPFLKQVEDNF